MKIDNLDMSLEDFFMDKIAENSTRNHFG
jgi:hypothetical protein